MVVNVLDFQVASGPLSMQSLLSRDLLRKQEGTPLLVIASSTIIYTIPYKITIEFVVLSVAHENS